MVEPLVSVVVLTYNHEKYIRAALDSVLAQQTNFPLEIVIGEDFSTDGTREIVFKYQDQYPDLIHAITSEQNVGMGFNARRVFDAAMGRYIAFCEGDDYWTDPLKLQKQVAAMEADPSITFTFHAVRKEFADNSRKPKILRYGRRNRYFTAREVILAGGNFYKLVSAIMNRSVLKAVPGVYFQHTMFDVVLALLSAISGKVFYIDEVMAVYRSAVSESWSQRVSQEPEFVKQNTDQLIMARTAIDEYTNFSYHKYMAIRNRKSIRYLLSNSRMEKKALLDLLNHYHSYLTTLDIFIIRIINYFNSMPRLYPLVRKLNRLIL